LHVASKILLLENHNWKYW